MVPRTLSLAAPAAVAAEVGPGCRTGRYGPEQLPAGAAAGWSCRGDRALDALCRRIAVLGHVLPDQPLRRFELKVESILLAEGGDRTTERVAEVRQRSGARIYFGMP